MVEQVALVVQGDVDIVDVVDVAVDDGKKCTLYQRGEFQVFYSFCIVTMIHSTTRSHFYTELELLLALYTRAKHQHRSQPFLANIRQVIRLATRVHDSLIPGLTDSSRFRRLVTKVGQSLCWC